jgi:hypothetical protein
MLTDTIVGLGIAVIVISSVAWVSQWRRIVLRMRAKQALRAERELEKAGE